MHKVDDIFPAEVRNFKSEHMIICKALKNTNFAYSVENITSNPLYAMISQLPQE